MRKIILLLIAPLISFISYSQGISPISGSQLKGTSEIMGALKIDSMVWLPVRALTDWPYANNFMPKIGGLQVNPLDSLPYYSKKPGSYSRLLTVSDTLLVYQTITFDSTTDSLGISHGNKIHLPYQHKIKVTTIGSSGPSTLVGDSLNIPQYSGTSGTVTQVTVNAANGFAGTVATSTTTPIITITTTVNAPVVKGNGTALIPAIPGTDYQQPGNYITGLTGDGIATGPGSSILILSTVNPSPGTFGSGTAIPIITLDAKGRATAITTVAVSAGTGTVTSVNVISANGFSGSVANPTTTPSITITTTVNAPVAKGDGTALIAAIPGTDYQVPGNYITTLTGDGNASGPGSSVFTLGTVNASPGTYGNSTSVPIITVDDKGRATTITTVGISAGTVTTVSVVSANGFGGTVANPTTTPAITLTTTVNAPAVAGNGTALSPATTTGTGSTIVLQTNAALITPTLGVAVATSINGMVITSNGPDTLSIASGKKLTVANTFTMTATDGSTLGIGTGGTLGTAAFVADAGLVHTTGAESIAGIKTFSSGVQVTAPSNQFGVSTGTQANNFGAGATTSGNTKSIGIGIQGLAGSTTTITMGSAASTTTTTIFGVTTATLAKFTLSSGTNTSVGSATLSSGTVTVSNTSVTASSLIQLTYSGTISTSCGALTVSTITAGTSFVIQSVSAGTGTVNTLDNNTVKYLITN